MKTRRFSTGKELLLSVVPDKNRELVVRYASVSGRRVLKTGEGTPSHRSRPMRVAIFSAESYFEQVDLPAPSVKVLPLVARRHVEKELVFEDTSYRLRARSRAKLESTIATDIAAVPESDLTASTSVLPTQAVPCLQMVPLELAIAALVLAATTDPVIVFWEKGGVLLSLLIADGMVKNRMRENVTDENRQVVIGRAEASLRSSATGLGERREIRHTLYTGDLCGLELTDEQSSADTLGAKLAHSFVPAKKAPKDVVLRDPELYGLPFVDEAWSFLEPEYRTQVKCWRYARPTAALASLAGVVFAALGGLQYMQALAAASDFDARRNTLRETINEIQLIRPSDEAIETVRSGLKVQLQSVSEVRLDRMLAWLTHLVPKGVVIRDLSVEPAEQLRRSRKTDVVTYEPGEKPFLVKMQIMLADTTFDAAEASSAEVVRRLSQRLQMVDSRLDVPAPEPGVRRNVVLVVDAHARAIDF